MSLQLVLKINSKSNLIINSKNLYFVTCPTVLFARKKKFEINAFILLIDLVFPRNTFSKKKEKTLYF
jgi:hypothetical protein